MSIDKAANAFMIGIENPALTYFSKIIAIITEPEIILVLALLFSFALFFKYSKRKGIFIFLVTITTAAVIKTLKKIISRERPLNSIIPETGFSLPSGHATIALVFIGSLIYLFSKKEKRISTIFVSGLIILLVGISRVYLRVHWLTDIIAGFVLGGIILAVTIFIDKKIKK